MNDFRKCGECVNCCTAPYEFDYGKKIVKLDVKCICNVTHEEIRETSDATLCDFYKCLTITDM